jgi:hypothetical protein
MPVTIEPVVTEDKTLDLTGPVTFEQYSEALQRFHAEFISVAIQFGWDKPSAMIRRITLEFPERRTSKVTPARIAEDLTQDMFTPEGWLAFTAKTQAEYAQRLVLFRKRLLKLCQEDFSTEIANGILKAAGLPEYEEPKGFRYQIGSGPRLNFTDERGREADVAEEVQQLFAEFYAANGWVIEKGYTLPGVAKRRGPVPIPETETAPLL